MYDVIMIDSGINTNHKYFRYRNCTFGGVRLQVTKGQLRVSNDYCDQIGHGTAIAAILVSKKVTSIFCIKLFDSGSEIDDENLFAALLWIKENIKARVIHISAGIRQCTDKEKMENICNELVSDGFILVSAFDNYGALSYPASFKNVIGVDMSYSCTSTTDYIYVENSPINIRAFGLTQRVPWINNEYMIVSGTSFAAPHITSFIVSLLKQSKFEFNELHGALRQNSSHILVDNGSIEPETMPHIHRAIVLPFNKEIETILWNFEDVYFDICGFFDHPYMCGANRKRFIDICQQKTIMQDLHSWNEIDWDDDFDTVIVGHLRHISDITHKDFLLDIIRKCKLYQKNIVSFDSLKEYREDLVLLENRGCFAYYPHISERFCNKTWFGKMHELSTPVLGIMGTGKAQGKFSLQLALRRSLIKRGYSVGQLGSEPSSEFFGLDYCYPIGYFGEVTVGDVESIENVRFLLQRIEEKDPDIIIVGGQSQTLATVDCNSLSIPIQNHYFMLGASPDAYLIVVNVDDDFKYIERTIKYCESLTDAKVLGLVISPIINNDRWSVIGSSFRRAEEYELHDMQERMRSLIGLPVFLSDENEQMVDLIISYFAVDENEDSTNSKGGNS